MADAAGSPFTVTGSFGICTRFPFDPAEAGHLEGMPIMWHHCNPDPTACQGGPGRPGPFLPGGGQILHHAIDKWERGII